jgi:prevent-host-death family protein
MPITTISSREFNQHISRAKRAAKKGPVFISDRGRPSFVLLDIEEYEKITRPTQSIVDLLRMPEGTPEFEFDFPRLELHARPVDFD